MKAMMMVFLLIALPFQAAAVTIEEVTGYPIVEKENQSITLAMIPEKCINVTVKKRTADDIKRLTEGGFGNDVSDLVRVLNAATTPLDANEEVILLFQRNGSQYEDPHTATGRVSGTDPWTKICFYGGSYSGEAYLLRHPEEGKNFTVEKDEREYCIGIGGDSSYLQDSKKVKQMTQQSVSIIAALTIFGGGFGAALGGVVFLYTNVLGRCGGYTKEVDIPEDDLDLGDTIIAGGFVMDEDLTGLLLWDKATFYVFSNPTPTIFEELALLDSYVKLSEKYFWAIKPTRG